MGRYIGPKTKIARKFGEAIFGTDKALEKKNYPPGQHGLARKRKKVSEYGTQLLEKQKAKAIVVYRLGIAPTRAAARQLVSHRHITVNGNVVNIPSYSLKEGDTVGVREKSKSLEVIQDALGSGRRSRFAWLEWEGAQMTGKFLSKPERADIPENVNEQLIVELYSK